MLTCLTKQKRRFRNSKNNNYNLSFQVAQILYGYNINFNEKKDL